MWIQLWIFLLSKGGVGVTALPGTSRPLPKIVSFPRFSLDSKTSRNHSLEFLHEHGFVIYAGVASDVDVARYTGLFWHYMEGLGTGIDRRNSSTWGDERWPPSPGSGVLAFLGIGQSEFMWAVRANPAILEAFSIVWDTNDLLVSLDGAITFRPFNLDGEAGAPDAYWYHVDQHPWMRPVPRDCVQGILALTPTSDSAGGLVLVPGSDRMFPNYWKSRYGDIERFLPQVQFFAVPSWDPEIQAILDQLAVLPHLERGDLIIWYSDTIHGSIPPAPESASGHSESELRRLAALVTMTPRHKASANVIQMRKQAACDSVTATHWPHLFHNTEEHSGIILDRLPDWRKRMYRWPSRPILQRAQLRLLGYSDEELLREDLQCN